MKKALLLIGLALFLGGYTNAQENKAFSKKVAEGNTNTPFGRYKIELNSEPVMLEGEAVTSYRITYEKSPFSVVVLVDKEKKCKNYIVISEGLSIMYTCNGQFFGVNMIDPKYNKEGYMTDNTKLDKANFFHQKIIVLGKQEEVDATALIASYYPLLPK
jgi:hypothetical protein